MLDSYKIESECKLHTLKTEYFAKGDDRYEGNDKNQVICGASIRIT